MSVLLIDFEVVEGFDVVVSFVVVEVVVGFGVVRLVVVVVGAAVVVVVDVVVVVVVVRAVDVVEVSEANVVGIRPTDQRKPFIKLICT